LGRDLSNDLAPVRAAYAWKRSGLSKRRTTFAFPVLPATASSPALRASGQFDPAHAIELLENAAPPSTVSKNTR